MIFLFLFVSAILILAFYRKAKAMLDQIVGSKKWEALAKASGAISFPFLSPLYAATLSRLGWACFGVLQHCSL